MIYNNYMEKNIITQYFEELDTTKEYNGYFCSVAEAVTIVILGSICGLKNISQIHQWASSEKVSDFLKINFAIENIPCYYWLLCLLKLIIPESLNRCFIKWAETMLPEERDGLTISVDGKTIRSTGQMKRYENPLHIVSAQNNIRKSQHRNGLFLKSCSIVCLTLPSFVLYFLKIDFRGVSFS